MNYNINFEELKRDAEHIFHNGFACSEAVIFTIRKHFALAMSDDAIAMSSGFPWGLGGGGCICGALAGATMCLGFLYGRRIPNDPKINKCFELTNELHDKFRDEFNGTCCRKLMKGLERNDPKRKAGCTEIVKFTVEKTAEIILNQQKSYITKKCNSLTGTKLFNEACSMQLDYFRGLKKEIEFTFEEKVYIDIEQTCLKDGAFGVILTNSADKKMETIYTGKRISSMSVRNKKERAYQILADEYDVNFIFDDNVPNVDFYPLQLLEIFAFDSFGGFFCLKDTNGRDDLIYYVDKELNCYCLASNMHEFLNLIIYSPLWKTELLGYDLLQEKSEDSRQYLTDRLKLGNDSFKKKIKSDKSIKIYSSYEKAKKVISFYDLSEISSKL